MAKNYKKDPNAVLDYGWRWKSWLAGDVLTSSEWAPESDYNDIYIEDSFFNDDTTTLILSGGTVGSVYRFINHITSINSEGFERQEERTIQITMVER